MHALGAADFRSPTRLPAGVWSELLGMTWLGGNLFDMGGALNGRCRGPTA